MTIALSIFKISFILWQFHTCIPCIFITSTPSSTRTPPCVSLPPHVICCFFVTWCVTDWNVNWLDLILVLCRYYCSKFMSATAVPCQRQHFTLLLPIFPSIPWALSEVDIDVQFSQHFDQLCVSQLLPLAEATSLTQLSSTNLWM